MKIYTDYKQVNQKELEKDIENIKEIIGNPDESDYQHLLKMKLWTQHLNVFGFSLMTVMLTYNHYVSEISNFYLLMFLIISGISLGIANVSEWANIAHPILHGAYDKIPGIPKKYTKKVFAQGKRRIIDWFDWIKPEAWAYEHNIMHHYHLGENDDPDNVEKNMVWLHKAKIPMFLKYAFIYVFAMTWKFTYYAPNTLRILENKRRLKEKLEPTDSYDFSLKTKNGKELWFNYYLPYGLYKFVFIPSLFIILDIQSALLVLLTMLISEIYANLHSFLVIVPNHSAEDIYQFSTPHKSQGEYYLRQIMGSVNYNTGNDLIDFGHGFLNYQIEHHLFPNMPSSFYQKMQPLVKEVCKKHNLEYRQENVFKRMWMTIELMVGKTKVKRIEGI
jgi:fatty acid desaturase